VLVPSWRADMSDFTLINFRNNYSYFMNIKVTLFILVNNVG
jgi:hypothetical protein